MAPVTSHPQERRREPRRSGGESRWHVQAVLRPGQPVMLVNINTHAALLESHARLRPGAHTEMQVAVSGLRTSIRGRFDRCYVAALEPIRYRGVLVFDHAIEL